MNNDWRKRIRCNFWILECLSNPIPYLIHPLRYCVKGGLNLSVLHIPKSERDVDHMMRQLHIPLCKWTSSTQPKKQNENTTERILYYWKILLWRRKIIGRASCWRNLKLHSIAKTLLLVLWYGFVAPVQGRHSNNLG